MTIVPWGSRIQPIAPPAYKRLTPIFSEDIKPVRPGVYLVECPVLQSEMFALWDGQHWGCSAATIELAAAKPDFEFAEQAKRWRGLSYDPIEAARVKADLRINQLKSSGALRQREDHQALVAQIQEGGDQ